MAIKASQGVYADESGPEMRKMLLALSVSSNWPLETIVEQSAVVPDDPGQGSECVPPQITAPVFKSQLSW